MHRITLEAALRKLLPAARNTAHDEVGARGRVDVHREFVLAGGKTQRLLERRLDNVIYRLGLATSRSEARQLVRHGHFLINGKKVDIPSYAMRLGDTIAIADPYLPNPVGEGHEYWVYIDRVIGAILLGVQTHDANLLMIEPAAAAPPRCFPNWPPREKSMP